MNVTTVSTGTNSTLHPKTYKIEMLDDGQLSMASDDDDDDIISTDGSMYDGDFTSMAAQDDVANQLAAAGPVGVAAAAAIASSKKRKRPHTFETNPSVRKRQQNRLLRKLRGIIYEFTGRVGKQAVVLVATPGKPNTSYKVFGAKPLEDVVRNLKNIVMDELESALAQQAPPPPQEDPSLFELPPLIIDGIPTPVEKMTQAQLRAFIPLMLKYSTGRGKPGWGRESTRPPWWPKELPWANVRMDARSEDDKQKISWTHALRKIVINCYKYHGREDLLPTFADDDDKMSQLISQTDEEDEDEPITTTAIQSASSTGTNSTSIGKYTTQTVLSTIQNADGTVSLIQVDPNNPIITLPDGTTAQVQGVATLHQGDGGATIQTVQSLSEVNGHENMTVDLTEATVAQDGQIYITAEDGQGYPVSVSNMITVPVSASMYQSMMANIQQIHTNGDGTVCITPMQVDSHNNTISSGHANNNRYQCYSIMAATPETAQRLFSIPPTGGNASTNANANANQNQNQTNLANSSSNRNNSNSSSNIISSSSSHGVGGNRPLFAVGSLCNVSSQQSSNHSGSDNSDAQHLPHHTHQLQLRSIAPATTAGMAAKICIANTLNNNNSSNNNNNNNNNNTTNNMKMPSATALVPLPIILTASNSGAVSAAAMSAAITASAKQQQQQRSSHKRRKQTFSKVIPIKLEENSGASVPTSTTDRLLNIQIIGSSAASSANNNNNNNNNNNKKTYKTVGNNSVGADVVARAETGGGSDDDGVCDGVKATTKKTLETDCIADVIPTKVIKLEDLDN